MATIYEYTDYRKFLSDDFAERQAKNAKYSYRSWAEKVGMNAGTLTRIVSGKRNISPRTTLQMAKYCKLSRKETEYFQLLVLFNQARTLDEKTTYFERMRTYKNSTMRKVNADQYEFYGKWYYTAVREILSLRPFRGDYKELAQSVVPRISPSEAKASIELLDRLGFIKKNDAGEYVPTDALISTGFDTHSIAVYNFQREMLSLAGQAYDRFPTEARNFSTLTLSISEKDYTTIVDELRAFRRRAMEIAGASSPSGRVYQFNFQVFPVSAPMESRPS